VRPIALTAALAVVLAAAASVWLATRGTREARVSHPDDRSPDLARRLDEIERRLGGAHDDASGRAFARRLQALEERLARVESLLRAAPPDSATDAAPAAAPDEATSRLRERISLGLATSPRSGEHAAAVDALAAHLVAAAGPPGDETELAWATRALLREAVRDRIGADDAERLEPVLLALPVGNPARTPLAQAVAIGWSADPRMGALLARFPTNTEPELHQGMLAILDDEHPSDAFGEYVIRLIREEREPAVLGIALGLDRIEAAATSAVAPRIVQVIEERVAGGDLDVEMRRRAALGLAVAGLRARETGTAALRRLADREPDGELADRLRAAADHLASGDATLKSLERLLD